MCHCRIAQPLILITKNDNLLYCGKSVSKLKWQKSIITEYLKFSESLTLKFIILIKAFLTLGT